MCAFVNSDVGTKTVEALHEAGVKLILMRCAGFNNVDLKTAAKYGIDVRRVPGYSPEAVAEHAMTLAMTVNRHMHKAYTKVRENDLDLTSIRRPPESSEPEKSVRLWQESAAVSA